MAAVAGAGQVGARVLVGCGRWCTLNGAGQAGTDLAFRRLPSPGHVASAPTPAFIRTRPPLAHPSILRAPKTVQPTPTSRDLYTLVPTDHLPLLFACHSYLSHPLTAPAPASARSRDLYTLVPTRSSTSDDVWEALEEQEAEEGGQGEAQQQGGEQEQVATQVIMSSFMGGCWVGGSRQAASGNGVGRGTDRQVACCKARVGPCNPHSCPPVRQCLLRHSVDTVRAVGAVFTGRGGARYQAALPSCQPPCVLPPFNGMQAST